MATFMLRKDQIIDHWEELIENGAGNAKRIMQMTETFLKDAQPPNTEWGLADVSTGFMSPKREFLVVLHNELREYQMFLGARDFGRSLDASWFLTVKPGFLKRAISKRQMGSPIALSQKLTVFAQQDLNAYASVAHRCFKRAVEIIMEELQQDVGRMQTKSKGFLSIW
jgi:hypothetical protein